MKCGNGSLRMREVQNESGWSFMEPSYYAGGREYQYTEGLLRLMLVDREE